MMIIMMLHIIFLLLLIGLCVITVTSFSFDTTATAAVVVVPSLSPSSFPSAVSIRLSRRRHHRRHQHRHHNKVADDDDIGVPGLDPNDEWGIRYYYDHDHNHNHNNNAPSRSKSRTRSRTRSHTSRPPVPSINADEVVQETFQVIAGTLYNHPTLKLDPAIVVNARSHNNGLFHYRPLRDGGGSTSSSNPGSGRIGIEIDGAEFLFPSQQSQHQKQGTPTGTMSSMTTTTMHPKSALRRFAFLLAAKLASNQSWTEYENNNNNNNNDNAPSTAFRPVVLMFNSMKETLSASRELQRFKQQQQQECNTEVDDLTALDYIILQTLSDGIPTKEIVQKQQRQQILHTKPRRKYRTQTNQFDHPDPTKGLLILVQPSDFNHEYDPAIPSVTRTIQTVQSVIALALLQQLPVVLLSPRLVTYGASSGDDDTDNDARVSHPHPYSNHNQICHNQDGFYQQASYWGGVEPPNGPAPFLLRDLYVKVASVYGFFLCVRI